MIRALALSVVLLALGACATPYVQPPLTPPAGFAGPRIEADAFVVDDGGRCPTCAGAQPSRAPSSSACTG